MEEVIIVKYGELMLKGRNRPYFVNTLIRNIKYAIDSAGNFKIEKGQSLLYLIPDQNANIERAIKLLPNVFGVVL